MYTEELVRALSGVSQHQLRAWRSRGFFVPQFSEAGNRYYSFEDLLDLRVFSYLRGKTSLQSIRRAFSNMQRLEMFERPSAYRFAAIRGDIVVQDTDGTSVNLVKHPGQYELFDFEDIVKAFTGYKDRQVLDLRNPLGTIMIDAKVRGGWPVLHGTRVGYDDIASYVGDGSYTAEEVREHLFPMLTAEQIGDALAFDNHVAGAA